MKASWRNYALLLALCLLGAAAPLAQVARLVETHQGGSGSLTSYMLQAAPASASLPDLSVSRSASSAAAGAETKTADGQKHPQPPRLIRLLPDHWDVAGPLELALAEVPASVTAFTAEARSSRPFAYTCPLPFSAGPPGIVSTRGPPVD